MAYQSGYAAGYDDSNLSGSSVLAVQQAIFERLTTDTGLMSMVTGVHDNPPETGAMPYVQIGDSFSTPDNTHGEFGRSVIHTVHVWARARSNKPTRIIGGRIGELLDHQITNLVVAGHRVVSIRQEFDQDLRDPEPDIRHLVLRFRVLTTMEGS